MTIGSNDADRLCNLRFADDVVLLATSEQDLVAMLEELAKATDEVGLELHMDKTKIMANSRAHISASSSYVCAVVCNGQEGRSASTRSITTLSRKIALP